MRYKVGQKVLLLTDLTMYTVNFYSVIIMATIKPKGTSVTVIEIEGQHIKVECKKTYNIISDNYLVPDTKFFRKLYGIDE